MEGCSCPTLDVCSPAQCHHAEAGMWHTIHGLSFRIPRPLYNIPYSIVSERPEKELLPTQVK